MANLVETRIPVSKVMENVTMRVTVTGAKTLRVRVWLSAQLFKLGAQLCHCRIEMSDSYGDFSEAPKHD